jgi:tRNA threonylcarbamoyladenosine biosynthesis protein TsaE
MVVTTSTVEATRDFGARVAAQAQPGDIYALEGELGTGKTEFVRGFVAEIDRNVTVRSPSFAIVNTYTTERLPVYHFDFYRLCDISELDEIGFEEYVGGEGICLIEWATMFRTALPPNTRLLRFHDTGVHNREIRFDFPLH